MKDKIKLEIIWLKVYNRNHGNDELAYCFERNFKEQTDITDLKN